MELSQDDPRRSLRPPDGGRDDLLGEVMRKKRHRPDPSGSKQELSRLAGSGGSVLRIGIDLHLVGEAARWGYERAITFLRPDLGACIILRRISVGV